MVTVETRTLSFQDLGTIGYQQAWDYQEACFQRVMEHKLRMRGLPAEEQLPSPGFLLFCEHHPVVTMGKIAKDENLLVSEALLKLRGVELFRINRGGDVTFHGAGQLVGYPIIDLDNFFTDIGRYLRSLEEVMIRTLATYGIEAGRLKGATGVWIQPDTDQARKICAIGIRCSRWITMHGWAFNVNTDLSYFDLINPCGLSRPVTSMQRELQRELDMNEVKEVVRGHFAQVFECELNPNVV
jgi:lipoyl(octanoyl) transferase